MKLNKKGFTLVELLAVVVILLAISVIAISSISAAIERNKNKQDDTKKALIESYAKLYYERNKNSFHEGDECITIGDLLDSNLNIEEDELKDSDGNLFEGGVRFDGAGHFTFDEDC